MKKLLNSEVVVVLSHTLLDNSRNVCLEPPDPALKKKNVKHVYTYKTRLYT